MKSIEIYSVLYSLLSTRRVVLLKEIAGERYLPIWIGTNEADAISRSLQGKPFARPLTHDLFATVVIELGAEIKHVLISELRDGTFYAQLALEKDGQLNVLDARPSDAIALAVRMSTPIFAEENVLEQAGIIPTPDIRPDQSQSTAEAWNDQLNVFRDFVDTLDLDDLGD